MFPDDQLKKTDIDTIKRWVRYKLREYIIAIKDIREKNMFFRGVFCEPRPSTISRLSYPPPEKVTKLQRANRVGQPRFYCSVALPGVFYELRAKAGDFIALSEWEVTEPLWMHNLGFHRNALQQMGTQDHNISLRQQLMNPIPNETAANNRMRQKLSKAFTADVPEGLEYRYKQSIAISEWFPSELSSYVPKPGTPKTGKIAGIVYPALKMRGDADNVVLLPEFVESSLKIKSVRYVKIEATDEKTCSYTVLVTAFADTFSINNTDWRDNTGAEEKYRSYIALEDGKWVLRDGYHRIYDVH
jgi:hypothetical protein